MKKQEQRMVQMKWSEGNFKNRGTNIWLRKTWWFFPLGILVIVFGFFSISVESAVLDWIFICVAMIWAISIVVCGNNAGNKYWEEIKDKKEPIELEELSKYWWWNRKKQ